MGRGRIRAAVVLAFVLLVQLAAPAAAEIFNGVDFPQGASSFADDVVSFTRGTRGTLGVPGNILGPPDGPGGPLQNHSVTLGNGGTITVRFTNNVLTGSGTPAADLFIFETGTAQEFVTVELSRNGSNFTSCGQTMGQTGAIDIDACGFGPGDQIFFVRITDIFNHRFANDTSAGADIDAIGAITTLQVEPPVAVDDAYSTDEGVTLTVNAANGLLANDSDPNGQNLTVVDNTQPAHGTVTVNPDGSFEYIPDPGFAGTDTFQYTVENEDGIPSTATVTIEVNDLPPIARNDEYTTDEDTPLTVNAANGVLANDEPGVGDFEVISNTQPANGTVTVNPDGSFTYTPNPGFVGTDTFEYTAENDNGDTDPAIVTIIVEPVNGPPNAVDDEYEVDEDSTLTVNPGNGVLANDDDPDGDTLAVSDFTQPANGTLTLNSDGSFEYIPDPGFSGDDTFEYTVEDENGETDTATVTITVNPVADAPNARDDEYETDQDTQLTVNAGNGLLANDDAGVGDLEIIDFTEPDNGTLTVNPDGSFEYTPDPGFSGTDTFEYTVENDEGEQDTATVTITVNAGNEPPNARDDEATTPQGDPVKVDVLDNDEDPDGDPLEIVDVSDPDNGTTVITDDEQIRYEPDNGFNGHDRFEYTIDDGNSATDTAEVVIKVEEKNDPPVTEDDKFNAKQDTPKEVDNPGVLKNDDDPEGDNLDAAVDEQPDNGHVDIKDNGGFTYTPDPGFHGGDEFTYWAKDGHGNRSKGRVRIHVEKAKGDEPGLAVAGDGGVSTTNADGGAVVIDDAEAGSNVGNAVAVEATAGNAALDDPASDSDGDGLSFEQERKAYGTDPWAWDSDGDGRGDGDEVLVNGTNPLAPEPSAAEQPAEPVEAAPVVEAAIDPALVDLPVEAAPANPAVAPIEAAPADPAAVPALSCTAYPGWLEAQSAYEAAGRTAADPAIVAAIDPDWDGIACEEGMQP